MPGATSEACEAVILISHNMPNVLQVPDSPTLGSPACVAVIGEALMDLVPAGADDLLQVTPGGSPANVALGLARLDVPVELAARFADDVFGRRLRAHFAHNGVGLSFAVRAREPTSLAIVSLNAVGGAEYDFRVDGTADWQWTDQELSGLPIPDVLALHTGSLAAVLEPGAEAIHRFIARSRGAVTISYDPNCRPRLMGAVDRVRPRIEQLVTLADVVKVSADDLAWLMPGRAPTDLAAEWLSMGPSLVAVTLGADGVVAMAAATGAVFVAGRSVQVVDTVGAGDAFVSALLAALYRLNLLGGGRREALRSIESEVLRAVLEEAVLASAITCGRRGAAPPTRHELALAAAGR